MQYLMRFGGSTLPTTIWRGRGRIHSRQRGSVVVLQWCNTVCVLHLCFNEQQHVYLCIKILMALKVVCSRTPALQLDDGHFELNIMYCLSPFRGLGNNLSTVKQNALPSQKM
jgi:hypothetical protein